MAEPPATSPPVLAAQLLAIGAVSLSPDAPYTWASGLAAPLYCDNRLTMAFPALRRALTDGFVHQIQHHGFRPDVIVGTATAGIPHAAWLADRLGLPLAYVRSAPKAHGRGNQIEGRLVAGQRAVVIEDLVSTGGSSLAAVAAVQAAGVAVEALLAIFTYGLPTAVARMAEAGVFFAPLTTFDVLLEVAEAEGQLPPAAVESLRAWQHDPQAWSAAHQAAPSS